MFTTGDQMLDNEAEIIGATKKWLIEELDQGNLSRETQEIAKHLLGESVGLDQQVDRMKVYVSELEKLSARQEELYMDALVSSELKDVARVKLQFGAIDAQEADLAGVYRTLSPNPVEARASLEQWLDRTVAKLSEAGLPWIADNLREKPLSQPSERNEILKTGKQWYLILESWRNSVRRDPVHYMIDRNVNRDNKVTLLYFGANPHDQKDLLDQSEEVRAIRKGIKLSKYGRDEVIFDPVLAVRFTDVASELRQGTATIVHFSAHGEPDKITLKNESGKSESLYSHELVQLLKDSPGQVQLVVLTTCSSSNIADELSEFIPCTIGMLWDIFDKSGTVFSSELYRAICDGVSIQAAFDHANRALKAEGEEDDRGAPIIYPRTDCDPNNMFLISPRSQSTSIPGQVAPVPPSMVLDWSVTMAGDNFDIVLGIRNIGRRAAKNVAFRIFNSETFRWERIAHLRSIYERKNYDLKADSPRADSVLVKSAQGHIIHVDESDWSIQIKGVWAAGTPFREFSFPYEIYSEENSERAICNITRELFAERGHIPELGWKPDPKV